MKRKLLAYLLSLTMAMQLLPVSTWALEVTTKDEEEVTPISTEEATETGSEGYVVDDATMANLNSIVTQIQSEGITAYSSLDTSTKVLDLSNLDSTYVSTDVTGQTVSMELGSITVPARDACSFRWDIIGLNPAWSVSLFVSGAGSFDSGEQVYLTNTSYEDKTYTVYFSAGYSASSGYSSTAMNNFDGYVGMIYNAIQFTNPVNMMFYQDGSFRDTGTVFVGYDKTYPFYGFDASSTWTMSYEGNYDPVKWGDTNDSDVYWSLFSSLDTWDSSYTLFEKTADAIFASGDHSYSIQTDWTMSGFVASGYSLDSVWMSNASVWPYDENGDRMGVTSYYSTDSNNNKQMVYPAYPFCLMDEYGDVYSNIPVYFHLNPSNTDFSDLNTLEMVVTGSGMPSIFWLEGTPDYMGHAGSIILQNGETTKSYIYQTYTHNSSIEINDIYAPTLVNIYANDGFTLGDGASPGNHSYASGQYVPITLEFSEPVDGSKLSLTINDVTYSAEELHMDTFSTIQTAWYPVLDVDMTYILVSAVTGLEDLSGNTTASQTNNDESWSLSNVTLETVLMRNAVTGVVVDTSEKTVTMSLNQDEAYQTKYAAYYTANDEKAPFTADIIAPDGTVFAENIQFDFSEVWDNASQGYILVPSATLTTLPVVDEVQTYTVQITAYETAEDTEGFHLWWYDSGYGSIAKTQLTGVEIVYPTNDTQTLSLSESYRPQLSVNYTPTDLTCPGGIWSSSNTDIATIDENGNVLLTGDAVGTVNFTFTANNGTEDDSDDKTATTHDYTVLAGDFVSLLVPDTFQNIVVREGNGTTVFWSSNANLMPGYSTVQYQVEVFEGYFTTAADITGEAVYTSELFTDSTNSYVIPAGYLNNLSLDGAPNYTICISIPATDTTIELTALAWVTVNAQEAGISLTAPASLYLLDNQTASIGWDITNFGVSTNASLTVTRVEEDSTSSTHATVDLNSASDTYTFTPATVTGLKDTYMFTAKVSNNVTDADDIDGFIMYVYNDEALDIELGGEKIDSTTLSNTNVVDGTNGTLPTTTADILALREELALIEYIGINYDDYSWSMLKDGIAWSSTNITGEAGDSDIISINYKQGALYENLKNFTMATYLPQTEMLLSSVTDGKATITATHANTNMTTSVEVTIDTLRDEFYLFQISPMMETKLTYTDGEGTEKTVTTNSEGYLALYEPEGINSEVDLWAKVEGTVYLGSIAKEDLSSGERDSTFLQLYPLNSATMRQVAQLDLYLTNPDGSPFTGTIILNGGVYVDDVYADKAQLRGNGEDTDKLYDGDSSQKVNISEGYLTVYFDSTQFGDDAENLSAKNKIQYILELSNIEGNGTEYYPQLIYANTAMSLDDIMYSASSIVTLEDASGNIDTPFIESQYFLYENLSRELDIKSFTGRIGPNKNYSSATIYTEMLLWGETVGTAYSLYMVDENGYQPTNTSGDMNVSEEYTYPFSSIPVIRNTLVLSQETMTTSGWIQEMTDRGVKLRLENDGVLVSEKTMSWRVLDMTNVEDVMADSNVSTMVSEMLSGSALGESSSDSSGNAIISGLLGVVTPMISNIGGSPFNIIITPTENNAVFNCLIWGGYDGMGLDDMDYSDTGLALESDVMNASISMTGISDLMGMAGGDDDDGGEIPYDTDPEPSSSTGSWGASFEGQLQGYYQGEISYNFTTGKWEIHVLEGGFTAGFQGEVSFSVDASASGIPLFVEISMGGAVQLDFKMATRYQQIGDNVWAPAYADADTVNDYLTTLRLMASVGVFGGIGFDYSIVSFKIGPYGEANIDSSNLFLTRSYLEDTEAQDTDGQYLKIDGEIGAKLEATFLIFSTEVIFGSGSASYAWDWGASQLSDYWDEAASYGTGLNDLNAYSQSTSLTAIASTTTLQSRDYLAEDSTWLGGGISLMALDDVSGLSDLQENANPDSYPTISDDGYHLLYISDQNSESIYDSRVFATTKTGTSYLEGSALSDNGYGDSNLSLAGDSSFAAAAWVRMTNEIEGKNAGDEVTTDEQVLLLNSTEIMVSLYKNGSWSTTALTANGTPDLAPNVATNDDGDAIVTWRSVYSGTGENLMTFDAQDYIMYSVYDSEEGTWSTAKTLYNGSAGAVMGLDAQMLPDGTAMVSYTIDRDNTDGLVSDYEIAYSIVDNTGTLALSTVVTSDTNIDENPQIVVANLGDTTTPDYRFILGWYTSVDNVGDIKLLAVNSEGVVSNSFPESLAKITNTLNTTIGSNFSFARMDDSQNSLENLTILWEDIIVTNTGEADYSVIRAVSFTNGTSIGLTSMVNMAVLPANTLLNHIDAYVSGENEVKAVIQGTYYDPVNTTEMSYTDGAGITTTVNFPVETTMLYTATETFENRVEVQSAIPDYSNLALNSYNSIQFSVFNGGLEDIAKIDITIGTETYEKTGLSLAPNESILVTCLYPIGDTITDLNYEVEATFVSGDTKTQSGTIYLDYPDIGISQMTVVKEEEGLRTLRMSLYNASLATLAGDKERSVAISFYDGADIDSANAQTLTYTGTDSNISFTDGTLTITGEENLKRIDDGVFVVELTYNVKDYVENTLELTEIPDTGVRLYADADVIDDGKVLPELNSSNNFASVSFESLLTRVGETISLDIDQANDTVTTATITLKNNSLQSQEAGGSMIVSLLDENGLVIEQQQVEIGSGTMTGEAVLSETVTFTQAGNSVTAEYGELVTGSSKILSLTFAGQSVKHENFTQNWSNYYTISLQDVPSGDNTLTIWLEDNEADYSVAVQNCTQNPDGSIDIEYQKQNIITITVTRDGVTTSEYTINAYTSDSETVNITPTVEGGNGTLSSFEPVAVAKDSYWSSNIGLMPTPIPDPSYVFAGWYDTSGNALDWVSYFDKDTTVVAKFTLQTFNLINNSSSAVAINPVSNSNGSIVYGEDATFKLVQQDNYHITNCYYTINGVTYDLGAYEAEKEYTIPKERISDTVYISVDAVRYYTITFQEGTGSTMISEEFYSRYWADPEGNNIGLYKTMEDLLARENAIGVEDLPVPTANEGYRMATDSQTSQAETLWVNKDGVGVYSVYAVATWADEDDTFTARAIKVWDTSFVSADEAKGTVSTEADGTYDAGETITLPEITPVDGYVLDYWESSADDVTVTSGTGYQDGLTETFTAYFTEGSWDIYYPDNLDGVSVSNAASQGKFNTDATFELSSSAYNITGVYYTIAGSNTKTLLEANAGTYTIPASAITGDISITIEADDVETVYFMAGENGTITGQTAKNVATGGTVTTDNVTITPDTGHALDTWSPELTNAINGTTTFTASFVALSYTLTLDASGEWYVELFGKDYSATIDVTYGEPVGDLVVMPAMEYMDEMIPFIGWYDENYNKISAGDIWLYTENQTAKPSWWYDYTFYFYDSKDNSLLSTQYVDYSTYLIAPTAPTREGYTFDYWYEEGDDSVAYDFTVIPDGLQLIFNLYAHWTANIYTLTFDLNGGVGTVPIKYVTYDSAIGELGTPMKSGYTFDGWTIDGVEITESIIWKETEGKTAVANWVATGDTAYTVIHKQQNLDGSYSEFETENKTGYAGTSVTPAVKNYEGFTAPSTQTETILGDGSLVITYEYARTLHDIEFVVDGNASTAGTLVYDHVMYGDTIAIPNVTPNTGYTFDGWDKEPETTVAGDATYTAQVNIISYKVQFLNDVDNTAISVVYVDYGNSLESLIPDSSLLTLYGYVFTGWSSYTYTVTGDTTIYAQWIPIQYNVSFDENGGSGFMAKQTFSYGETKSLTANAYTHDTGDFMGWSTDKTKSPSYGDEEVVSTLSTTPDETVALYAIWGVDVTWNYGDGTTATTEEGLGIAITKPSDPTRSGYSFRGWYLDDGTAYDFDTRVTEAFTLTAKWTANATSSGGGGSSVSTYDITITTEGLGTISPEANSSGKLSIASTDSQTIYFTPHAAFIIQDVLVDGVSQGAVESYTFDKPIENHSLKVIFSFKFTDVSDGDYCYDAVLWAAEESITTGTDDTTFSPLLNCTRAQAVTFLWRASGSPMVSGVNQFTDVSTDSYYYDAVQWAVASGITKGTDDNTFSPDAYCTRDQIVTFLYRTAGEEAVTGENTFTDVDETGYYYSAVLWAVEHAITTGTDANSFSPSDYCTRAQIVTFLYRYMAE